MKSRSFAAALAVAVAGVATTASPAAASPGVDDPTAPAGYVLQETIIVPVDGSVVSSTTALAAGVWYKLRATGTAVDGAWTVDAEYRSMAGHSPVQDIACRDEARTDSGIGINDAVNDILKTPKWGAFSDSHSYTIDFAGTGATINLNYHDCDYEANSGSLTVHVFRPLDETAQPRGPDRAGYCTTTGQFVELVINQHMFDPFWSGKIAHPAFYVAGKGITCDPPFGLSYHGSYAGPDAPPGIYPYYH
jgi:hypothetical protein